MLLRGIVSFNCLPGCQDISLIAQHNRVNLDQSMRLEVQSEN